MQTILKEELSMPPIYTRDDWVDQLNQPIFEPEEEENTE